jgi:ABC-type nitrate/sulfonate/bicarbonate transport system ATPase subunit
MMLEIQNASKSRGSRKVLDRFSAQFPEHGNVCLIGPSGCGKTTLFSCLAGVENLNSGRIVGLEGRKAAVVFQEDRLLPWFSAAENIAAVLSGAKWERLREAELWLNRVGLGGEGEKLPAQLSGGMQRRVALARALAFHGDLLLLDEPFQRLDSENRNRMAELLLRGEENRLRIFITHDPEDAARYADVTYVVAGPPLHVLRIQ